MPGKRGLESTQYPGIYKRITAEGKLEGYQIKPRFPGYSGPRSFTRERLTDARELLDQIRQDLRKGLSGGERRRTLAEAVARYCAEELPKLALSEQRNGSLRQANWGDVAVHLGGLVSRGGVCVSEAGEVGRHRPARTADRARVGGVVVPRRPELARVGGRMAVPARVAELERVGGGQSLRRSPPALWNGRCRPRGGWSSRGGVCVSELGGRCHPR